MVTRISVKDATRLIAALTGVTVTQALQLISEAIDLGLIHPSKEDHT